MLPVQPTDDANRLFGLRRPTRSEIEHDVQKESVVLEMSEKRLSLSSYPRIARTKSSKENRISNILLQPPLNPFSLQHNVNDMESQVSQTEIFILCS